MAPPRPGELIAWRLDRDRYAAGWDSGEGAWLFGGRWNSPGTRVVYCALDAATAILEVAVHKGFQQLGRLPHVMSSAHIADPAAIRFFSADDLPDPRWLEPGDPSPAQQAFGDGLLRAHPLVAMPSVVSRNSWNLLIAVPVATGYRLRAQEPFVLDPRLAR
jgi:RES domain-containing protein